ncbi:MAG: hypothetical protein D6803_04995, partial [Anaerolineae bacterium]
MDAAVTKKRLWEWLRAVLWKAPLRNRALLLGDLLLIVVAVMGSFALRLELGPLFSYYLPQAWRMTALALVIKPLVYHLFGLYRRLWAYASTRELNLIVFATSAASTALSVAVLVMVTWQAARPNFLGFPRSVLVIDWLLSIILVGGLR